MQKLIKKHLPAWDQWWVQPASVSSRDRRRDWWGTAGKLSCFHGPFSHSQHHCWCVGYVRGHIPWICLILTWSCWYCLPQQLPVAVSSRGSLLLGKVLLSELYQSPISFTVCPLLLFLVLQDFILFDPVCLQLSAFFSTVSCDHISFLAFLNWRVLDYVV